MICKYQYWTRHLARSTTHWGLVKGDKISVLFALKQSVFEIMRKMCGYIIHEQIETTIKLQ